MVRGKRVAGGGKHGVEARVWKPGCERQGAEARVAAVQFQRNSCHAGDSFPLTAMSAAVLPHPFTGQGGGRGSQMHVRAWSSEATTSPEWGRNQ
eukprot:351045-Chlamydomonas_euryale.AAC.1